jgi:hypothetical protein
MSSSPTKASSPAAKPEQPTAGDKSIFTNKEERVLKAAWFCLKSPPEVDMEKLRVAADFNTPKTASNTWGLIKKKLATLAPPPAAAEGVEGDGMLTIFSFLFFFALLVGWLPVCFFCCFFLSRAFLTKVIDGWNADISRPRRRYYRCRRHYSQGQG